MTAQAQVIPDPPVNDHFTNAVTVTGTSFELTADLVSATAESFEPHRAGWGRHTAWWRWTAPQSGIYTWEIPTNSPLGAVAVSRRDSFQQLIPVGETVWRPPAGITLPDQQGSFQAEAGLEYFFQVDVALTNEVGLLLAYFYGPLILSNPYPVTVVFEPSPLPAPANDSFAARITLSSTNVSFGGSLFAASSEPDEPHLPGEAMQRTLWWRWIAPGPGTAIIRSQDINTVPLVGIFRRGWWNQLELLAHSGSEYGNECVRYSRARPELRWDTVTNTAYDIVLDRFPEMDPMVDVSLHLEWLPAPPNDNYSSPQWLNGNDLSLIVSNTSATYSEGDDYRFGGSPTPKTIWFAWQASASGILQVTTNEPARFTDPDFHPMSYSGVWIETRWGLCGEGIEDLHPLPPFIPVWALFSESGYTASHGASPVTYWEDVDAGREYRIGLAGLQGSSGTTVLNLLFTPPPINDRFANRVVLPQSAVRVIGRTFAASADAGHPPSVGSRSVWWEWRAPHAGTWALRILTGGFGENHFVLFRGANATAANEVKRSLADPLVFAAGTGETFQIGVFAKTEWGNNVAFELIPATAPALTLREVSFPFSGVYWALFADGTNGLRYRLESSTNLHEWWPVLTNQALLPQEILRVNLGLPRQFFRTQLEQ